MRRRINYKLNNHIILLLFSSAVVICLLAGVLLRILINSNNNYMLLKLSVIIFFSFLLYAILITSIIHHWFSKPLMKLSRATAMVARGDYSVKLDIHRPREFELMAEIFNRMTDTLKSQYHSMEDQIYRRTEELEQSLLELSKIEKQNIQQERLASLGQLAAGIGHEINNPTSYLYGNSQILAEYIAVYDNLINLFEEYLSAVSGDKAGKEAIISRIQNLKEEKNFDFIRTDLHDVIEDNKAGIEKIMVIVRQLKSYSRKDEERKEEADLNEIMENALHLVWNRLKYNIRVEKKNGDLSPLWANKNQIEQVIVNLLINATDAMDKDDGVIILESYEKDGRVFLVMEDNGCGMDGVTQKKIFEPFFTTKESGSGTGLGLSISLEIIKAHEGLIEVESEIGKGTIFRLSFPACGKGFGNTMGKNDERS